MAKNIIILLIRKGLGALISMLCTTLIIKSISVDNYGIYSVFLNTVTMFSIIGILGVDASSCFVLQNEKYDRKKTLVNIFFSAVMMTVITIIFTTFFFYNIQTDDLNLIPNHLKIYLIIATVCMLFSNIMFAVIMGNLDFKNYSIFTIVPNLAFLLLLYFYKYVMGGLTLENTIIFYTLGYVVASVAVFLFHVLKYDLLKNLNDIKQEIILHIYKYGVQSYLSNVITFLNYRINIFIIGYFLGVKEVGIYSTCLILTELIWLLSSTLASITYPLFSNPKNIELRKKMLPVITRTVLLLSFLATIGLYLLGNPIISLLFGDNFLQVRTLFIIAAPGIILLAGSKILAADFTAQGKPKINILINLSVLIITIITNFIFIPLFGIKGAALATSISFSSFFIICLSIYCYTTKTHYLSYILPKVDDIKLILKNRE